MWWWAAGAALAQDAAPVELTLGEALDRLHADGPDLAQAQSRVEAAHGMTRQAAAAFLPVLAATGGYIHNDSAASLDFGALILSINPNAPTDNLPGVITLQPLELWNAGASLQVPLFAPSAWADWSAARHAADQAGGTAAEVELQLESTLVALAANGQAAKGLADAAQRAVAVAEAHQHSSEVAVEAGTAAPVDVLTAKADLARRRSELVQAQSGLAKAQEAVGALLGVDGPVLVTFPADPGVGDASKPRPALDAAAAQVDAAHARVDAAWFRQFPTVSATGNAAAQTEPFPTGSKVAWKVGLNATWVLYDGGFRYGRLQQAHADQAAATAFQTAEQLRVSREQRDAQRDLDLATQQLALANEQSAATAEAAQIAQRGLAAGTTSALQARDVELLAYEADVGVAAAQARLTTAQAALRRARGLDQRW